jgi:hypothetical protein
MVDIRKNVMKGFAKQGVNNIKDQLGISNDDSSSGAQNNKSPIDWNDYNYPKFIRLIHYSTSKLRSPYLGVAKRLHYCAILVTVVTILNLLNTIIQVAASCRDLFPSINVLYTFLNIFLFNFVAYTSFACGFYAICQGPHHYRNFRIY